MVIAHLSDTHIDDGDRSIERTAAVMRYLENLPYDLDAILITGDIADHGSPAEYELARELFVSRHPVLMCPGNHDDRAAFREHLLGEAPSTTPINQSLRAGDAVVALCDSSVPGKDEGLLEEATTAWLADLLARTPSTTPVLVGFHHPPALLHEPFIDGIRQFGAERVAALADRHDNIVAFLSGHAHTAAVTTFAGRPLLVAPGVVSTLRLPWEDRAHPKDIVHLDQPPALAFHVLDDMRLTTHYRNVV
ncbi:metallophosphoesterase [Streptosporangium sp. NPDC000396]|uniref:metallophosphoesterase n=1 Tax=Streptosporangium sp. NPDC000396 TaxID=3366185 RepID=UPI00367A4837